MYQDEFVPMTEIEAIRKELNHFSFTCVIKKANYGNQSWKDREAFIQCNTGCCELCGETKPRSEEYNGYSLKYVSHGAHALDFCESMGVEPDDSWNDIPVLFLFENPSLNYEIYDEAMEGCGKKCPAKTWYWIHDGYKKDAPLAYPQYYRQGCYGGLVASLINTFKLRNAYMTNFVKCAMNDPEGKRYLGTAEYQDECVSNCFKKILSEEMKILTGDFQRELIVFTFGNQVYDLAQKYFAGQETMKGKYTLCLMPHPANRLANEYRKYVVFGKVYKTLTNCGANCDAALKEFLNNDKFTNVVSIRFCEGHRKDLRTLFENKGISINERKTGADNSGTITVTPTEIKCRFKLPEGKYEFGFVAKGDGEFWIWNGQTRSFLATAEEVSAKFAILFDIFHEYINELGQGGGSNEQQEN